jgi:hypothetical protein
MRSRDSITALKPSFVNRDRTGPLHPSSLASMTVIAAQTFISLHAARPVQRAVVDYTPSQRALMPLLPLSR